MEETYEFKLVEGNFSPEEAEKVLLSLLQSKISYHNLESLSTQIRFGGDVSRSERRVRELKQINESLLLFLKESRQAEKILLIEGNFKLKAVSKGVKS